MVTLGFLIFIENLVIINEESYNLVENSMANSQII